MIVINQGLLYLYQALALALQLNWFVEAAI